MAEYYRLKQGLVMSSLVIAGLLFGPLWWSYSLKVALSYLLGALSGIVYLRLLAKNVEQLGTENPQVGKNQLGVFIGLIIVATQWHQLSVLPIFLGFLTYKVGIIVYVVWTTILPPSTPQG
ncbi:MAG: ATP synthase subunit I [Acaryochloridaceae cyanobacterium SU_2_1]|nr:ATP synthase subunit I [Acaryochloridaceae cyanobacterium SU_2_1]